MKRQTVIVLLLLALLLGLALSACGEEVPVAATVSVATTTGVVASEAPPTATLPPTPTLRPEPATEIATAVPEATETAPPTPEEAPTEQTAVPDQATAVAEAPTGVAGNETPTTTATAARPADPQINGMPASQFIMMPPEVRDNVRAIFAQGQLFGRDPGVFSILGDSLIATPQSLAQWDQASYTLGEYAYLQQTIDQYTGSFGRYGPSVRVGLHSWSVFDPLWADKEFCQPNEDVLNCELRLSNPSVALVFLGSNDAGVPGGFKLNYEKVVETLIANGVVPILATKADRFEGPDNANNIAIREVAAELQVPLLEFDLLANTLPGRGLGPDNVHLSFLEPLDYTSPGLLSIGYPVHNLAVLMILDEVREEIGV